MEFRDLKTQYLENKKAIDEAIQNVLINGQFIGGEPVNRLEQVLADYVGTKHCITCANGTDALQLALMAMNVGEGDAVFVPDFTFFSSGEIVPWVHATPIFVDVDKESFNISVESLEHAIKKVINEEKLCPKVVIAVDLFGCPADYTRLREITNRYGIWLLEDGAQGFGGRIRDQVACSFGDIATTSFFPAKPLGCYGDGGAVFTDNDDWAELIRSYKVHGKGSDKYDNVRIGLNSRLDTIQAAILLEKMKVFQNYELQAVNQVASWYTEKIQSSKVVTPIIPEGFYSSWAQYTILLPNQNVRNELQQYLKEKHIPSMVYYAKPMHKQIAFVDICHGRIRDESLYCNTTELCERVLSLPMHPYLREQDVDQIVAAIHAGLEGIKG